VFTALVDRMVGEAQPRWRESAMGSSSHAALREMLAVAPDISRPAVALADASLEYLAEASRDPDLSRRLALQLRAGCEILTAVIRRGIAAGEFQEVDAEAYALAIVAAGKGLRLLHKVDRAIDFERAWGAMVELALRGLSR
jgi:hypothetical protein